MPRVRTSAYPAPMPTVEDAENFLLERLWDGEFEWSADVKAAAGQCGIPPKLLWLAQEPRGCVPLDIIDIGFPRRTAWRLDPVQLSTIKAHMADHADEEDA